MDVAVIALISLFLLCFQRTVSGDETTNQPVMSGAALGGMVQGLLNMQIRPEGGFYEERYKEIFPDDVKVPLATSNVDKHMASSPVKPKNIISEDGKLLVDAISGKTENPCFDQERVSRNRLLLLMCSLQLVNEQTTEISELIQ